MEAPLMQLPQTSLDTLYYPARRVNCCRRMIALAGPVTSVLVLRFAHEQRNADRLLSIDRHMFPASSHSLNEAGVLHLDTGSTAELRRTSGTQRESAQIVFVPAETLTVSLQVLV